MCEAYLEVFPGYAARPVGIFAFTLSGVTESTPTRIVTPAAILTIRWAGSANLAEDVF